MIGRLYGTIIEKSPPYVVIDVHGVGYELEASMNTLIAAPEPGQTAMFYTHLAVREDAHLLYGFSHEQERLLFRELIRISGVGPRLALTILSGMEREMLIQCVHDEDSKALTRLPGVGKKTAERLIIELRDRLSRWTSGNDLYAEQGGQDIPAAGNNYADAESALIALGYKPTEAARMLADLDVEQATEALIKAALTRKMATGR
ncbi:Holliday junction branch migration protein RuvA [Larsenimonas rhizosphaerae]|uniref:Holliday junction branch migration complex subunit RuvA n=1 Tax=Larsenimonas rhizosphaerae TaxID=2944682 RepID=A0AA42CX24_9GAMM|nr:Holliday junction branch migration protein RuvA [Larsenimonas rhizosphaerae]MCM2130669.1 Holliday junction branch migration protein RuvA [Larsenimonas rhizosphaerae]MCX2523373.1 Holliday junction branch migration protein RuvA [Larsenimonas rhizosphaerae]